MGLISWMDSSAAYVLAGQSRFERIPGLSAIRLANPNFGVLIIVGHEPGFIIQEPEVGRMKDDGILDLPLQRRPSVSAVLGLLQIIPGQVTHEG